MLLVKISGQTFPVDYCKLLSHLEQKTTLVQKQRLVRCMDVRFFSSLACVPEDETVPPYYVWESSLRAPVVVREAEAQWKEGVGLERDDYELLRSFVEASNVGPFHVWFLPPPPALVAQKKLSQYCFKRNIRCDAWFDDSVSSPVCLSINEVRTHEAYSNGMERAVLRERLS